MIVQHCTHQINCWRLGKGDDTKKREQKRQKKEKTEHFKDNRIFQTIELC